VIVIIETVRRIIRPFTLAVRLAANMVAGHLLLALLGSQNVEGSVFGVGCLLVGITLLIFLEIAVACIQSYVFTILRSLYLKEIRTVSLNLK
jgi:F-type H+-transporting ATPase subunit a